MTTKLQVIKAIIREYKSSESYRLKLKNITWHNINNIYEVDNEGFYYYNNSNKKSNMYWNESSENIIDYMFNLI